MKTCCLLLLLWPLMVAGQMEDALARHSAAHSLNEMGFYKLILDSPVKLKKFQKWMEKDTRYHIVYYNRYPIFIAGANQAMVSRIGFCLRQDASPELERAMREEVEFIKGFMISDYSEVAPYRQLVDKEAATEAAQAKIIAEKRKKEAAAREKQAAQDRLVASMGVHCVEVLTEECDQGQYTFRLVNSCELPFTIKYSYLTGHKFLTINTVTIPKQDTVSLKACAATHDSFFFTRHSTETFSILRTSDEDMAIHHLTEVYEDVYLCKTCRGEGALSCDYCGGRGKLDRNGPVTCTFCSGAGAKTCYNCKGEGIFGLD